jgi:hypothetical protein
MPSHIMIAGAARQEIFAMGLKKSPAWKGGTKFNLLCVYMRKFNLLFDVPYYGRRPYK